MDTLGSLICVGGIVLMSYDGILQHQETITEFYQGFLSANAAAFINALINISIYGVREESSFTIVGYAMFFGTLTAIPGLIIGTTRDNIAFWNASNNTLKLWLALIGTGSLSVSAQLLKTKAIQDSHENIHVVLVRYIDIPLSIAWDSLFFGSSFTRNEILGIACIFIGVLTGNIRLPTTNATPLQDIIVTAS
jgi:drug/metabolite transporter (DMT)-like permease